MSSISDRMVIHAPAVQQTPPPDQHLRSGETAPAEASAPIDITIVLPAAGIAAEHADLLPATDPNPRGSTDPLIGLRAPMSDFYAQSIGGALQTDLISQIDRGSVAGSGLPMVDDLLADVIGKVVAAASAQPDRPGQAAVDASQITDWQAAEGGGPVALAPIAAKQSTDWSDAQDQSERIVQASEDDTRPAAESSGFGGPRPKQNIATGAFVGAVLSSDDHDEVLDQRARKAADPDRETAADTTSGIMSSGILNAAMTPGWPPLRPFDHPPIESTQTPQSLDQGMKDTEILVYLANLGADEALLANVKKALEKPLAGRRIVAYLASLATALSVIFKSLADELDTITRDDAEQSEGRKLAATRGKKRRRDHLYLE